MHASITGVEVAVVHVQPALLYIVPGVIGAVAVHVLANGELSAVSYRNGFDTYVYVMRKRCITPVGEVHQAPHLVVEKYRKEGRK